MVQMFMKELDREILQVIIEAKFITISQSDLEEFGVNISELSFQDPSKSPEVATITNGLLPNFPAAGNLTLSGVISGVEYEAVIHALDEKSSTKTVSAPRVTVLNNHPATIRRGETLRYYEDYDLETVPNADGVAVSQPVPTGSVQEIDLGINLEVKPTISYDGTKVMLALHPNIKQFKGFDEFITAKLPRTDESEVETTVVVASGQTVVLGGMITETKDDDNYKIPLLGNIPILGKMFSHSNESSNPSHLLIFVTATIVDSSGNFVNITN
jgi:type II secretory pathway component GspD/PulD (secretin)